MGSRITRSDAELHRCFPLSPEITSFSEKSGVAGDVSADGAMAASDIVSGESGDDTTEKGDGKLSLRMKLVTPVEEGSSERFSLQSERQSSLTPPRSTLDARRVHLLGSDVAHAHQ